MLSVPLNSYEVISLFIAYLTRFHRVKREAEEYMVEHKDLLLLRVHRI